MPSDRILIIEDDEDISELMRYNLSSEGYRPTLAESAETGFRKARQNPPNLILLDLMLPGMDGLDLCRVLKRTSETENIPIIIVTARGDEADVVAGLEIGADDYIPKPFSPRVLLARVKAVLRRYSLPPAAESAVLEIADIVIDPGRHEVTVAGKLTELTSGEFALLHFLARHPGRVFSRQQIMNAVHGEDYIVTDRSIDVMVVGLRKKLASAGSYIRTVRGIGYKMRE